MLCTPPAPPSLGALRPLLDKLGLPLLLGLRPLGRRGSVWDWGLDLSERVGHVVLRVEQSPGEGLARELAAMQLLDLLEVPISREYLRLPTDTLGTPAALCLWPDADPGSYWTRDHPAEVFRSLGRVASILGHARISWHGSRADGGRFLPLRPSWRGEVLARLASAYGRIQAAGLDLGPLTSRALARVEAGLPSLESVDSFALVHGGLRPEVLYLGWSAQELVVHGITCWQEASLSDPLMEWPALLHLPLRELGWVLEGAGASERLLTEAALERVEIYALLAQLERLALSTWEEDPTRVQCEVAATLPHLLEQGWAEWRIRAARAGEEGPGLVPSVAAHAVLRRRALESLRRPLDALDTARVEAALALAVLAEREPAAESSLVTLGLTLLDAIANSGPRAAEPVGADWLDALLRVPSWGTDGSAEHLAWLGLDALGRVRSVSDAVRRGLEVQVLARRASAHGVPRHGRPRARVGLLGLASLRGLERIGGPPSAARFSERYAQHLRMATRGLMAELGPHPSMVERASRWAAQDESVVLAEAPLWVAALELGAASPVPLELLGYGTGAR